MINKYKIPEQFFNTLLNKIEKFNRKAISLNLQPITITKQEVFDKDKNNNIIKYCTGEIIGELPKLSNWQFIATIQHFDVGNVINNISGNPVPEYFRTVQCTCDHCKTKRARNDTYIIQNTITKEFKQIGKTCLKLFTRSTDTRKLFWYMGMFEDLNKEIVNNESSAIYYDVIEILARTNNLVEKYGWKSSTQAKEESQMKNKYIPSTADKLRIYMNSNWTKLPSDKKEFEQHQPTEKDFLVAEKILETVLALNNENDYIYNLQTILKTKYIENKNINLVCSAIAVYLKQQTKEKSNNNNSNHVANINDKITVEVVVIFKRAIDTAYGVNYLYKFKSKEGNILTWFTTKNTLELNGEYEIKGTVKEHHVFNNIKETVLTRVKVIES